MRRGKSRGESKRASVRWAGARVGLRGPALLLLALIAPPFAPGAEAAPPLVRQDEVVLEDLIALEVLGRDVYGFDAEGGGRHHVRLELGEVVVSTGQRGRLALVVTDRRALALAAGLGSWRELPLRVGEASAAFDWVAPRVLVVATAQRILGFESEHAVWLAIDVGPREVVTHVELGASTAVVVTDRHAYGFSPDAGGFFRESLRLHEQLERVTASATLGQVRTNQRLLVFRSPLGSWLVEELPIR